MSWGCSLKNCMVKTHCLVFLGGPAPAVIKACWSLQRLVASMASNFNMMPHSLDGNSTSLLIIELDQKTHWLSLTQRKRLLNRSDPHSLPLLCCLCLAAHAQKLVQPAWQDFNTCKSLHVFYLYISYLILESDITWIPSTMGPDSLPKATTTEGLRLQLQMWMANHLRCQLVHEWTFSVGYEVEVWLSCNRFKSRILKRYLGEPLSYVRLQSCAPSVRDTLKKPPSVLQKTPPVCQHECSFNVKVSNLNWLEVVEVWGVEIIFVRFVQSYHIFFTLSLRDPRFSSLTSSGFKACFFQGVERVKLPSTMATYQAKVNPYESPFSTSDQQIQTQKIDKLDSQLYTSQATQRKDQTSPKYSKKTTPFQS